MTDTQTRTFFGIPVSGDIQRATPRVPQRPVEELGPILQAVLDDPLIESFGWQQYTPYFNDGDPCEFGVHSPWFRTTEDDEDADTYDLAVDYGAHPTLGDTEDTYEGNYPNRVLVSSIYQGAHEATYRACRELSAAIGGGAFEDALLVAFGDHAEVTVTRSGIQVDFYEHD